MQKSKLIATLAFSLFIFQSCDLFTTRDAETPDQGRSNYQPPVQPSLVIENLKNSMSDKNIQNYMTCFVDSLFGKQKFVFSASSEAAANYPVFAQGWTLGDEQRYITNVFNKIPTDYPISLSFTDESYSNLSADSLIYSATYFLNLPVSIGESIATNYSGVLQFNMLRDSRSLWVIYYWKDSQSQSLPSWSNLKGSFN